MGNFAAFRNSSYKVFPNKQKTIKFYNLAWWKVCSCNFTVGKSDFQQSRFMISLKFDKYVQIQQKKIYFFKTRCCNPDSTWLHLSPKKSVWSGIACKLNTPESMKWHQEYFITKKGILKPMFHEKKARPLFNRKKSSILFSGVILRPNNCI